MHAHTRRTLTHRHARTCATSSGANPSFTTPKADSPYSSDARTHSTAFPRTSAQSTSPTEAGSAGKSSSINTPVASLQQQADITRIATRRRRAAATAAALTGAWTTAHRRPPAPTCPSGNPQCQRPPARARSAPLCPKAAAATRRTCSQLHPLTHARRRHAHRGSGNWDWLVLCKRHVKCTSRKSVYRGKRRRTTHAGMHAHHTTT